MIVSFNWNKFFSVLLVIGPTVYFGYINRPTVMLITLSAGFVSAFLLNIDKFESFKAGQIEAKLKEAEEVIDEATATIEQLTAVTAPLLKANLSFLLYEGVFDGMPADEQANTFLELVKIKNNLNITDVEEHFNQAAKGVSSHYFMSILREVGNKHDGFRMKYGKYSTKFHAPETPSIEELDRFFEKHPYFLEGAVKDDYRKFKDIKESFVSE